MCLQQSIFEQLRAYNYLNSEIGTIFHEAALRCSISDSVQSVFYTLLTMGPDCTQSDISRLSGVPKQTIHSAISKLERDGLIRLEGQDAKSKLVRLTQAGQVMAEQTVMPLIQAECDIFKTWSEEDRTALFQLTARYRDDLKKNLFKEKTE